MRALAFVVTIVALAACSHGPPPERTYAPYDGPPAYPNLRPRITLPAADFALVPEAGSDIVTAVDLGAGRAVGASPVGRSPVVLDGPQEVVADMNKRVAYVLESYPEAVESAGAHSHGGSKRPGYVQVLSLDDLRAIGEVRVDPNPGEIALSEDGRRLVVTHFDLAAALEPGVPIERRRSTLALVDPAAILPFGTPEPDKLLVCVAPHGLALSRPDGAKAYVACYGEDAIAVVDLADPHAPVVLVRAGRAPLTSGEPLYGPYGVALAPDGARLAVGMRASKDVRFVDLRRDPPAFEPLVVPALGETYVPAWSRDGARLYVPTRARDAITVVDTKTGASIAGRAFDPATCVAPIEAALGSDANTLLVVCEGSATAKGAVVTLDATTLDVRARVEVGTFPGRPFVGRGP